MLVDLFSPLTFLYFVTLHADRLSIALCGMTFRLNNLIALLLLSIVIARFRKGLFFLNRAFVLTICGITLSFILSFLFSSYKGRSLVFLLWWGITIVCYLFLPYILLQIGGAKRVLTLYFGSFLVVGLYGLMQCLLSCFGIADPETLQFLSSSKIVRASSFTYEPSYYVLYMTPFVIIINTFYVLKERESFTLFKRIKGRHLLFVNILFLISFATSALFALLAFAFIALLLFPYTKGHIPAFLRFFALYGGCLAFVMVLFSVLARYFLKFFYEGFMDHHSFAERWLGIVNGWKLFTLHPFVGVGIGSYPFMMADFYLTGDARFHFILQESKESASAWIKAFEPSNVFTEVMASTGIVGLIAFALFFFLFWRSFHTFWKGGTSIHQRHRALAFFLGTLVLLIVLQLNQGLFRTYVWTQIALCWAYFAEGLSLPSEKDSANNGV